MKTTQSKLPPPPVEEEDFVLPPVTEHTLRVGFIRAALSGLCATQESLDAGENFIVDQAFRIAELATERYLSDNGELLFNLSVVQKFNKKVGV